jgi:hypothetical protein
MPPNLLDFFKDLQGLSELLTPFHSAYGVLKDGKVEPGEVSTLMRSAALALNEGAELLDKFIPPRPQG